MTPVSDRRIEDMGVSPRVLRLLKRAACRTVADVVAQWPYKLARVQGVGNVVMQEIHERLLHLIPDSHPISYVPRPRRGDIISVPYARDKQIFLGQAAVAWEARAEKERLQEWLVHTKRRRTLERISTLEAERVRLLRCLMEGHSTEQLAEKCNCGLVAFHARRQRLIRRYTQPAHLARLPADLQQFILRELKKQMPRTTPIPGRLHIRTGT